MKLTRVAVYHPVVALTVTLALLLFGAVSYRTLGLEQYPKVDLPIVSVQVVYPGASARTVEEQVTRRRARSRSCRTGCAPTGSRSTTSRRPSGHSS